MMAFTALPDAAEVIGSGDTKTSIRTSRGLQVDLRVIPPDSWGAALQYFTGSQAHNVRIREIAVRKKLKLSEYGLFDAASGGLIVSRTEEEVYERLGMSWIPPTLREDSGEVQAALAGQLPGLVTVHDIRGDLHSHTDLTDGVASLEDMVATARARGYEYYAITDHAPNLFMQRMTTEKMLAQPLRHRPGTARLADPRAGHQQLAAATAGGIPAQGPLAAAAGIPVQGSVAPAAGLAQAGAVMAGPRAVRAPVCACRRRTGSRRGCAASPARRADGA